MEINVNRMPLAQKIHSCNASRYFMIKSFGNENIGRSLQHKCWATGIRNERILTSAFETAPYVILIFSVNSSSRFSGYALMKSRPGESTSPRDVFSGSDGRAFPGRNFDVQWIRHHEVFFRDCEHIINYLNENKPVKIGRDGQEVAVSAGRLLCELIDEQYYASRLRDNLKIEEEYVINSDSPVPHVAANENATSSQNLSFGTNSHSGSSVGDLHPNFGAYNTASSTRHGDDRKRTLGSDSESLAKRSKVDATDPSSFGPDTNKLSVNAVSLAQLASVAAILRSKDQDTPMGDSNGSTLIPPPPPLTTAADSNGDASGVISMPSFEAISPTDMQLSAHILSAPKFAVFPIDLTQMTYSAYERLCGDGMKQHDVENSGDNSVSLNDGPRKETPRITVSQIIQSQKVFFGSHVDLDTRIDEEGFDDNNLSDLLYSKLKEWADSNVGVSG